MKSAANAPHKKRAAKKRRRVTPMPRTLGTIPIMAMPQRMIDPLRTPEE